MTIWRMRIVCWIPKATDTHTQRTCNIYCFYNAPVVVRTRLNVTLYVHSLSCYLQLQYQFLEAKPFVEKARAAQVVTKFSFYET